jgi:hypothetical protein
MGAGQNTNMKEALQEAPKKKEFEDVLNQIRTSGKQQPTPVQG